jgi:hypothetical protein
MWVVAGTDWLADIVYSYFNLMDCVIFSCKYEFGDFKGDIGRRTSRFLAVGVAWRGCSEGAACMHQLHFHILPDTMEVIAGALQSKLKPSEKKEWKENGPRALIAPSLTTVRIPHFQIEGRYTTPTFYRFLLDWCTSQFEGLEIDDDDDYQGFKYRVREVAAPSILGGHGGERVWQTDLCEYGYQWWGYQERWERILTDRCITITPALVLPDQDIASILGFSTSHIA